MPVVRTPEEDAINVRIIERGLQSRPDTTLVTMLNAVTTKSSVYDEDIDRLTNFPQAELWDLKQQGITGARAQTELAETLQFYTDKKARLLDKKFLTEKEQEFRRDGKVVRVIVA